jgi:hypothetical protein
LNTPPLSYAQCQGNALFHGNLAGVQEVWRFVGSAYVVSSLGSVESVTRRVAGRDGSVRTVKGRRLRPRQRGTRGVLTVTLWRHNIGSEVPVKELVAGAFCGPRPDGAHAVCVNGDENDLRAENIAWKQ